MFKDLLVVVVGLRLIGDGAVREGRCRLIRVSPMQEASAGTDTETHHVRAQTQKHNTQHATHTRDTPDREGEEEEREEVREGEGEGVGESERKCQRRHGA